MVKLSTKKTFRGVNLPMSLTGQDINGLASNIISIVERVKEDNDKIFLLNLLKIVQKSSGEESFDSESFDIDSLDFYKLTDYSKKKAVAYALKQKYPDKEERKAILSKLINISDFIYSETLTSLHLDNLLIKAQETFGEETNYGLTHALPVFVTEMPPEYQSMFIDLLREGGVSKYIIKKFEDEMGRLEETGAILANNDEMPVYPEEDRITKIISTDRRGMSDFNPLVIDLDLNIGMKLFSLIRFKEIYRELFYKIASDLLSEFDGRKPDFNKMLILDKKRLKKGFNSEKEEKFIPQFIIEWELSKDYDELDMINIVKLLREEGYDINFRPNHGYKPLKYPRTMEGMLEYRGHFLESGEELDGDNVIFIHTKDNKNKKLRLSLANFVQDSYVYLITQIGYYLETGKFINKNQLYFNIYDRYNKEVYGGSDLFDIGIFNEQYSRFMEKLVIPNSIECNNLGITGDNILLSGIYGSGKSQFLLRLLKDKNFKYEGKEFNLNANVVYIDLQIFKSMLANGLGGFRTRIDEIYQNTGVPIILIIEDIDTLINEKLTGGNDEIAQAMTLFFEGIGSIPVKVITTANDPTKLSERLIRPNRIYEIIEFYLPTKEEKILILKQHLNKFEIELSEDIINKLSETNLFKTGTSSHIAKFVEELVSYIKIKSYLSGEEVILSDEDIINIANNINISSADIENSIKSIQQWTNEVTGKVFPNNSIGFHAKIKSTEIRKNSK